MKKENIQHIYKIASEFNIPENILKIEKSGNGHIHGSYLVETNGDKKYLLQHINHHVFTKIPELMNNIALIIDYLSENIENPRECATLIKTNHNEPFLIKDGEYYRVFEFVQDTICLQLPETDADFYEAAKGFGTFLHRLEDFPVEKLVETIPDFHNTPDRYRQFYEAIEADTEGRVSDVRDEINFILDRESEMGLLEQLRHEKKLPERVTHNDTKLNNCLLDKETREALCVIDLDTVMPGLSLYDFGDAIRYGASTAEEDERDLDKVELSLEKYEAFTRGFLESCPGLTELEKKYLALGAKTITLECGMRFLTDFLNGDKYFSIHRPHHNLDRARTQLKLVKDMEEKWEKMQHITRKIDNELKS